MSLKHIHAYNIRITIEENATFCFECCLRREIKLDLSFRACQYIKHPNFVHAQRFCGLDYSR